MAQEKPAVTTVVQSRLLNIIDAVKRAKQQDGIWLTEHAVHKDLRLLADKIEQLAKTPDAHWFVHNFNERSGTGYAGAAAFGTLHAVELTPRQADVLLLIRNHKHLHGYSPSIREIASMLSISRATVMAHLERMEKKNLIRRKPGAHRTLEVVADVQGVTPRETPRERKKAAAPPPPKEQSSLDWLRSTG